MALLQLSFFWNNPPTYRSATFLISMVCSLVPGDVFGLDSDWTRRVLVVDFIEGIGDQVGFLVTFLNKVTFVDNCLDLGGNLSWIFGAPLLPQQFPSYWKYVGCLKSREVSSPYYYSEFLEEQLPAIYRTTFSNVFLQM